MRKQKTLTVATIFICIHFFGHGVLNWRFFCLAANMKILPFICVPLVSFENSTVSDFASVQSSSHAELASAYGCLVIRERVPS